MVVSRNSNPMSRTRLDSILSSHLVVGIDEVGMAPIAGPMMAAAVAMPTRPRVAGVRDSKACGESAIKTLAEEITYAASYLDISHASVEEIERVGPKQAWNLMIRRLIRFLPEDLPRDTIIIVDGQEMPHLARKEQRFRMLPVVRADTFIYQVSAASIVAKDCRDRLMRRLAQKHPQYRWHKNKGYPTPEHLQALKRYGPTEHHRRNFSPVKNIRNLRVRTPAPLRRSMLARRSR